MNRPVNFNDPTGHAGCDGDYHGSCADWAKSLAYPDQGGRVKKPPYNSRACETIQSIVCLPKPDPKLDLPSDYTFGNSLTGSPVQQSSPADDLVRTLDFGLEGIDLLDLIEDGIQYGRPAYRQVKYAVPLGGWEYLADGLLQVYDDRDKNLTFGQRVVRGLTRAAESAITDGASILVGGSAAAALQANVPIPVVSAGVGYVVGSYATSNIVDSFFVNKVNPYVFDRFLGGP